MVSTVVRRILLIAAVLLSAQAASIAADRQFVGFLEDRLEPAARVAFEKTSAGWKSFCPPDQRIVNPDSCRATGDNLPTQWTVVYRSESKGTVLTSTYHPRFVADVGLFTIEDTDSIPTVGEQDREFAGQIDHTGYRPLVVVANPQYADPQGWAPLKPEEVDTRLFWRPFKDAAGKANTCAGDLEGTDKTVPIEYQLKQVQVFQAYASKQTGARIVSLQLDPGLNNCDGPRTREWSTFWFYVDAKDHVRPLDFFFRNSASTRGYVAKVLDWGDYDSDGQSEMVFWLESSNEDGYVIFYDNFSREATFSWVYR